MIKRIIFTVCIFLIAMPLLSYSKEVQSAVEKMAGKELTAALEYLEQQISSASKPRDKRDLLVITASVQESSGFYELACRNYEKAAGLQSSEGSESASSLLLKAARCALSFGDSQLADSYLSAVSRTAVSSELGAKIKLYAVWSWLSKISDEASLHEPLVILSSYTGLKGMETVQSSILLTLWHLTGDAAYSTKLIREYPLSMEAAVVQGNIHLLPSPFWYFVPRKMPAPLIASGTANEESPGSEPEKNVNPPEKTDKTSDDEKIPDESAAILHYQLGFFRNRENAQDLIQRLTDAGFKASVQEELRQSGTLYFAVIVKENPDGNMGAQLKNAGFECYPVFE